MNGLALGRPRFRCYKPLGDEFGDELSRAGMMRLMPFNRPGQPCRNAAFGIVAGLLAAAVLSGCGSTSGVFGDSTGSSPSMSQRFSQLFSGSTPTTAANPGSPNQQDIDCPVVDIRQGASTYSVNMPGNDPNALALRYQGVIGQTARECAALGATMTIKLGVQGRIILGPAGTPGPIEIPMRFAVVREGPEPKTIWTKFYRIPLNVEPGQNNTPFVYVEEDLTFPMPKPAELEAYVIYVGFDPMGLAPQPRRPTQRR